MIALNVWGRGMMRMLCALIGLGVGYAAAAVFGLLQGTQVAVVTTAPWIGLPTFDHLSWSFDSTLALPFAIAAIAVAMKAVGTMTMCQRMNDADWVRVDMSSARRGVLADGAATMVAGAMGTVGMATAAASVGVASATGVGSRRVAHAAGFILLLLGSTPKLAALLAIMPRAVMVAALLFAVGFHHHQRTSGDGLAVCSTHAAPWSWACQSSQGARSKFFPSLRLPLRHRSMPS